VPVYLAGYVFGNATIRFGSGFTVARQGGTGSYRITILAAVSSKNFATVATPVALHTIARIAFTQRDGSRATFDRYRNSRPDYEQSGRWGLRLYRVREIVATGKPARSHATAQAS
jgi:hypothetical protein